MYIADHVRRYLHHSFDVIIILLVVHCVGYSGPWAGLVVFDTFVFSITFYKAIIQWRNDRSRLIIILIRDG